MLQPADPSIMPSASGTSSQTYEELFGLDLGIFAGSSGVPDPFAMLAPDNSGESLPWDWFMDGAWNELS